MSDFGVLPTGFIRKPLVQILREVETDMIEVFGPQIIQTSESPLGQINGVFADKVNDIWELAEDVYHSNDPDQAEDTKLTSLAKLRVLQRGPLDDIALRREIANEGVNKFDLKDVEQNLIGVDGITYLQSFQNDNGDLTQFGLALGDVCVAIQGGDDTEIADRFSNTMPIGSNTFGNTVISTSEASTVSQDFNLLRVSTVRVALSLRLELQNDTFDLFQPDIQQMIEGFVANWKSRRINGLNVSLFTIRREIECLYPNIRLVSFTATVDGGSAQAQNNSVSISFSSIAEIVADDVTAVFV